MTAVGRWLDTFVLFNYIKKSLVCQGAVRERRFDMEKNHFKERYELRVAALGISKRELAAVLGVPQSRIAEAVRGDVAPAASALRVRIDQELMRRVDEKRAGMVDEVTPLARKEGYTGPVDVVMPEDVRYIVTECGFPVGWYNPVTGAVKFFDLDGQMK